MKTITIFAARLLADGYTLRARKTQTITASETDTEEVSFGAPFGITVSYETEYFGIGLPMVAISSSGTVLVLSAFYYDCEQRTQAHLYRLESGDYLAVQRQRNEDTSVRYTVELYSKEKTGKVVSVELLSHRMSLIVCDDEHDFWTPPLHRHKYHLIKKTRHKDTRSE